MPPKDEHSKKRAGSTKVRIEGAGKVLSEPITHTLTANYMPYAMSVIISRAIPEIDGFKPSHRKILYTMYKMGLLSGARTKSANVVGQTMRLNPHGDMAIYETMVRLSRGNEALLHAYVDSKGNFGKAYSRDMAFAASRYTEVKLDPICNELFRDIDKKTVDFVDNYDSTMQEPVLLPAAFPSILINSNIGIAVGMASSICPFNLTEVCETTIRLMKDPAADLLPLLKAPDFPGGGLVLYDADTLRSVYETGRGSLRVRARYQLDKAGRFIEITEIPPTTTVEAIMDRIVELVKTGKVREIADIRDETDLSGLKLTIDLKRGADGDKLMSRLFRLTPLEDTFGCNFNVLVGGRPQVLGVRGLLRAWTAFRMDCVRRRLRFDLGRAKDRLHLLRGLEKILLDIDKAVRIVRETDEESEVVPNLMIGFGIDEVQAEFVAEIKLRHFNRAYILEKTQEIEQLEREIADLEATLGEDARMLRLIADELRAIVKKYGRPRRSLILYDVKEETAPDEEEIPAYPVTLFLTREGYFKKITPQSLRMSGEQKLKESDALVQTVESTNGCELLFFTDRCQVYKSSVSEFEDGKASVLGDYLPARLGFDEGEALRRMVVAKQYDGWLLFIYANGKAAKVELASYKTKTRRRKLVNAYSDKESLVAMFHLTEDREVVLTSSAGKMLLLDTGAVPVKTTHTTQGVTAMTLKPGQAVTDAQLYEEGTFKNPGRYRVRNLPGAGQMPAREDTMGEQLHF
ncbi:DNA gyrase subunit A [Ethanoligenens harbinense]|uniref:DNA topoisomerase (ATP-hydrolyzing) n=1 Tax=Ethanoligenens harbinense (strain DSM 18485 / JCM 12961 / CGMCC 1.5033 / YUAN-3) TaxID=663278 RepID=E6U4I4_ETHHY|nr:DNA gyrase subunit A [Ethanoligenens harbinense]ADU27791.1 DNA topoisomerase (ATP-hydrolyzing) [Ethanoligenens harbinense YUAN-3]AVQ96814.1 topoisomerase IV [Ethanoligenens harbinense YUAN-3]AYF39476.1 topoisomerase IV [Ethanoligenens harbinense]AYF42301.1 topoisomerase IV [Ethanoligenens harbinense]QCN93055.1 topoisomerase IV [Ethanoligenens harbinense]